MNAQQSELFDLLDGFEMTKSQHDWLERRFENMTVKESLLFRGAMQIERPQMTADVMLIANQLDHYDLFYGAGDDARLGKFVMEQIQRPSSQAREFLDPEKVGAAYRQKSGNIFCDGHFVHVTTLINPFLDGDPTLNPDKGDFAIRVKLASRSHMDGVWVGFPDTGEYMDAAHPDELLLALDALEVESLTECKITHHEGWQLAGIFADDGISGVSTKKREQFNKMIELCRKKKIDLILTKSISRFARNTLDCIKHVRILKSWGIPVIFEKENIDTSNMNSEMILTCLSSFAQAESESISGNVTKGIRMGYRQGRFSFRYKNFLGYRKGPDGEPEIVPEEAKIIRLIAQNYLNGDSLRTIKETLESMGVPTATGNQNWSTEAIQRILQNEKYMGDVLLQKTYTADFIEGKVKKNNGELPQYYIKDNHPAIIPREMFYQIQEEIARRKSKKPANAKKAKTNRGRFTSKYALSERLVCGSCGCYFRRVTWSIHGRKQIVWRCINRLECGPKVCKDSPSLKEDELYSAILKAIRSLVQGHQEEMAATLQDALIHCIGGGENAAINPLVIENRLHELDKDLDRLLTMDGSEIVDLRIKQISDEMLQLRQMKKRAELDAQQDMGHENKAKEIMALISAEDLDLTEYSDTLVYRVIERVTVLSKEEIRIRFVGGFELTQPLH